MEVRSREGGGLALELRAEVEDERWWMLLAWGLLEDDMLLEQMTKKKFGWNPPTIDTRNFLQIQCLL